MKKTLIKNFHNSYTLKTLSILSCLSLSFFIPTLQAHADQWVHDDAHVLNAEQIENLGKTLKDYQDNDAEHPQMIVFIEKSIPQDIEEWTVEKGNALKVGQKDSKNGIVFSLDLKNHKDFIAVGSGLSPILTDYQTKTILSSIRTELKEKNYEGAVLKVASQVHTLLTTKDAKTFQENTAQENKALENSEDEQTKVHFFLTLLIMCIFTTPFLVLLYKCFELYRKEKKFIKSKKPILDTTAYTMLDNQYQRTSQNNQAYKDMTLWIEALAGLNLTQFLINLKNERTAQNTQKNNTAAVEETTEDSSDYVAPAIAEVANFAALTLGATEDNSEDDDSSNNQTSQNDDNDTFNGGGGDFDGSGAGDSWGDSSSDSSSSDSSDSSSDSDSGSDSSDYGD